MVDPRTWELECFELYEAEFAPQAGLMSWSPDGLEGSEATSALLAVQDSDSESRKKAEWISIQAILNPDCRKRQRRLGATWGEPSMAFNLARHGCDDPTSELTHEI